MGRWLLGLVVIAIIAAVLALFGPMSAEKRSNVMAESIRTALDAEGMEAVKFDMKGHVAMLSGVMSSDEAAKAAKMIAKNADCAGCQNSNPDWHVVKTDFTIEAPEPVVVEPQIATVSPFTFSATKSVDGSLLLDGYVGSEADIARILFEAEALFPGQVKNDKLSVARGMPNASWVDLISKYLVGLSSLDRGNISMSDGELLVTGLTTDEAIRNRINALAIDAGLGYSEVINITVPDAASSFTGTVQSQGLCQTLFNNMKGETKINFGFDSSDLLPASYPTLNGLATAAQQCPAFRVNVEGHTDASGNADYNLDLSKRRADSVSNYLVSQGIEIDRLTTTGYGQTRPVASNDTPEGQRANRRIEFIVTQSE